jgi:hypothetical protein
MAEHICDGCVIKAITLQCKGRPEDMEECRVLVGLPRFPETEYVEFLVPGYNNLKVCVHADATFWVEDMAQGTKILVQGNLTRNGGMEVRFP